ARRRLAAVAQRLRRVEQPLARADDHRVARAEMLAGPVVHGPHALGDGLILKMDAADAGVADGLLRLAVDQIVVGLIGDAAEATVPVGRVRQRLGWADDLPP